jgi:ankyrin repeat protein
MHAQITGFLGWSMALLLSVGLTAGAAGPPAADSARRLVEAAKAADAQALRALLQQRVDVNEQEADGTTALHWAVHHDDLNTANLLIRAGANLRAANRYGVTPLALACVNGNALMIETLLKAGADPNTVSEDGETALMTTARTGKVDAVKLLLAHGADVNAKETWRGQTALMWAVAEHHAAVVGPLLEAGADVHARSGKGFTPFLFAVRGGDLEVARTLLGAGADVNEKGGEGTTALILAIVNAHYELAAFLLEKGADPNTDAPGGTALHAVTRTRNYEYGKVVRPAAVQTGNLDALDLVKVLFEYGADPNAQIVKPLPRQGGFDNNYLRLVGATPFLLAARAADPTLMRVLVDYGADPFLTTNEKVTPLMVAAGMGYVQGQSIGAERERLEAVKLLLDLGADVHAVSDSQETAMHGAATGGVNDVVQLLVDKGAKLDEKSKDGWTPLSIADGTRSAFRAWPHTAALLRELLGETSK